MTSLRYALRSLAKSRVFVGISVVALGAGLGLSTTMFAVMDAIVNPAMPYRDPEALYRVNPWFGRHTDVTSRHIYDLVARRGRSFEAVAPQSHAQLQLEHSGRSEQHAVMIVPADWFALTGVRIREGRGFSARDQDDVVLVSEEVWQQLFGKRRDALGTAIMLGGRSRTVIGMVPEGTGLPYFWLPFTASDSSRTAYAVVRLRSGVTRDAAEEDLKSLALALTRSFSAAGEPIGLNLYPMVQPREEIRDIHKAMLGAALAVLIIACVNLAHLMLARGIAKRRELALRMALGATRSRVIGLMFLECALIAAGGAALGSLIAVWGSWLLTHLTPTEVQWIGAMKPQLSWRVFALSASAAAVSAVLFGLLPAVRVALGVSLDEPLKDDAGTTTARTRQRYSPLVAAEVSLALVLLMGGALLLRTIWQLQRAETLAFNAKNLLNVSLGVRAATDSTPAIAPHELLAIVQSVPGVRAAAWRARVNEFAGNAIFAEQTGDTSRFINAGATAVSPSYFGVLGLPILKGRNFGPGDDASTGVAIIDALAAERLYPGIDPIGHMIKLGGPGSDAPWLPIVGVVRSPWILEASERLAPRRGDVFVARRPVFRAPRTAPGGRIVSLASMRLVVRTDSRRVATELTNRLLQTGSLGYAQAFAYDYQREAELASRRFLATVFVIMGSAALGLAVLGLYGVLAYAVNRRMREFAIRLALGAQPANLRRMVIRDGFVMILMGIGAGAFVALLASRWLDAVLIAVLPSDVISLVASEILLFTVGLAAALAPARRAANANPLDILRAS